MSLSEIIAVILGVVALITIILYVIMMRAEHKAAHTKVERIYIDGAILKQLPQKPTYESTFTAVCPSCGEKFTAFQPEYCNHCGQKLDWRGERSNEDDA